MAEVLNDGLSSYLREQAAVPFEWGLHDCATFVLGWLDWRCGKRALGAWLGQYQDEASCSSFIAQNGGFADIASGFFARHYGFGLAAPRAGNPVFAEFKGVRAMGLRVNERDVALRTRNGLLVTARARVLNEWGPE